MGFVSKMVQKVKEVVTESKKTIAAAVAFVTVGASQAFATGSTVTLPDTGIDMPGYITAAITGLGGVVIAVVGGYFAFMLVKKGLKWAGKALG